MSGVGQVVWDESLTRYNFGPMHPMAPVRLQLTMQLARDLGVLDTLDVLPVPPADDALLRLVHSDDYLAAVRSAGALGSGYDLGHGLGTPDVPVFPDMHDVSSRVAGATVTGARSVWSGAATHAFSPAGGLHHAMRERASGFCVYNDVAIAIAWLLEHGAERVAYVDVDVHHGDGVETLFWNDPRVLTISLHESPDSLFPGTGYATDVGGRGAKGYAVNVPLPAGTGDEAWLRALHSVVPHLLDSFAPDVLVTQHGCDSHYLDPLAHLTLTVDGQRMAAEAIHGWAHRYASGRWVAAGGGGYAVVDVVPRIWTAVMAELAGAPLDPQTPLPEGWREFAFERTGQPAPFHLTDGRTPVVTDWSTGYDPADPVDRAILATRRAVFPLHGLDPERD
jgi:acetoin utilization protein AcuC